MPVGDRAALVAALREVDYVTVFDDLTPVRLLERLGPDVHAKGGDYRIEDLPETRVVEAYGGRVVLLPLVPDRSTTQIVAAIKEEHGE
jgi:bifunctional ADP-heptose synthase (sugar kinase/adenylyltransferase)